MGGGAVTKRTWAVLGGQEGGEQKRRKRTGAEVVKG